MAGSARFIVGGRHQGVRGGGRSSLGSRSTSARNCQPTAGWSYRRAGCCRNLDLEAAFRAAFEILDGRFHMLRAMLAERWL